MEEIKTIECSVAVKSASNNPCMATIAGTAICPECGKPMCPTCHRHTTTQLSRVTGYIGAVSGWNAGKQQELKDRQRYTL